MNSDRNPGGNLCRSFLNRSGRWIFVSNFENIEFYGFALIQFLKQNAMRALLSEKWSCFLQIHLGNFSP